MNNPTESVSNEFVPDYTLAEREAVKLLSDTNITMVIVNAVAKVKKGEIANERDWPHVEFTIEFVNSKTKARQEFTYSYGLGLIDWKKALDYAATKVGRHTFTYSNIEAMGTYSHRLNNNAQIDAANFCIGFFRAKAKEDAANIFASICREGEDAATQTFGDWADTFGYDKDSRKAESIYNECQRNYDNVSTLVSRAVIKQFAELAARF